MTSTGKVTWSEIATNDTTAARAFCDALFGWQAQGDQEVSSMLPPGEGGIPGGHRFGRPSTASA